VCSEAEVTNLRLALDEALVNAVVHGNLEIPSKVKGKSFDELLAFNNLIKERRQIEPYCNRKVEITRVLKPDSVQFTITDEGPGFDWESLPNDLKDMEVLANHGRGLFLIRAFMTEIQFNEKGNCITMRKDRSD